MNKRKRGQLKPTSGQRTPEGKNILPETAGRLLVTILHQDIHLGSTNLSELLRPRFVIPLLDSLEQADLARCQVCAQVHPKWIALTQEGVRMRDRYHRELWENRLRRSHRRTRALSSLFRYLSQVSRNSPHLD